MTTDSSEGHGGDRAPRSAVSLPQTSPERAAEVLVDQARAYASELSALSADDWLLPTECPGWTVRDVAAHVAGALEEGARLRVMARHLWQARRRPAGVSQVDAINAAQIRDRAGVPGPALLREIEQLAPRAARARRRVPRAVRGRPTGSPDLPSGASLGYLFDVIYARDLWMHRVDTSRAVGAGLAASDSDGEVVGQVIRDLATHWSAPAWVLELHGRTPGSWLVGSGEPVGTVSADTVGYLRLLSGRDPGTEAVAGDADAVTLARAARVEF